MFHGWMFDPDGDQAAADNTRSSTSLDTGSSVNPRTARRLVTASYTSMIAYLLGQEPRCAGVHDGGSSPGLAPCPSPDACGPLPLLRIDIPNRSGRAIPLPLVRGFWG